MKTELSASNFENEKNKEINSSIFNFIDNNGNIVQIKKTITKYSKLTNYEYIETVLQDEEENLNELNSYIEILKKINEYLG